MTKHGVCHAELKSPLSFSKEKAYQSQPSAPLRAPTACAMALRVAGVSVIDAAYSVINNAPGEDGTVPCAALLLPKCNCGRLPLLPALHLVAELLALV